MDVFIVTQEGVYRHNIAGVYLGEQSARAAAEAAIRAEPDDYHSFHVTRMVVGEPGEHLVCKFTREDEKRWEPNPPLSRWHILKTTVTVTENELTATSLTGG